MVKLYYHIMSHPSRSVLLLARAIDLSLDLETVDLLAGEHYTEDFLKMNPQHSIPLIADDEYYLSESGAINIYLVEKYGKDDSLYPNDVEKRATINQRLLFLSGVLWNRLFQTYVEYSEQPADLVAFIRWGGTTPNLISMANRENYPVCLQNTGINDLIMDKLDDAFNSLNKYLDGHDWIAGDEISVADYSFAPIVSCAEAIGYDVSKYDNVSLWLVRAKETMEDYEDLNQVGLDQWAGWFHEKLSKIENLDN